MIGNKTTGLSFSMPVIGASCVSIVFFLKCMWFIVSSARALATRPVAFLYSGNVVFLFRKTVVNNCLLFLSVFCDSIGSLFANAVCPHKRPQRVLLLFS